MNRRAFLAGLTATAAGLMIPERKVWALDRTMITPTHEPIQGFGEYYGTFSYIESPYTRVFAGLDTAWPDAAVFMHKGEAGWHVLKPGDVIDGQIKIEFPNQIGDATRWETVRESWGPLA